MALNVHLSALQRARKMNTTMTSRMIGGVTRNASFKASASLARTTTVQKHHSIMSLELRPLRRFRDVLSTHTWANLVLASCEAAAIELDVKLTSASIQRELLVPLTVAAGLAIIQVSRPRWAYNATAPLNVEALA